VSKHLGWIQCTQCGWGCEVTRAEVDAGDYHDGQACGSCGIGPCRIDWMGLREEMRRSLKVREDSVDTNQEGDWMARALDAERERDALKQKLDDLSARYREDVESFDGYVERSSSKNIKLREENERLRREIEALRDVPIDLRSDMRELAERDHPIPPPSALTSVPNEDGMVTVRGDGVIEGAWVSAFNERTGEGVIGTADDAGRFELCLAAENGDSVLVWQRVVYGRVCEELGSDTHRDPGREKGGDA
jgi:hypothetical protein